MSAPDDRAAPPAPAGPRRTERIAQLEADNERLRELASAASRLAEFGRFAAEQNHELRQPLLAIKGLAQLLGDTEAPSAEEVHETARLIVEQADRMARLIGEFKNLSSPRRRSAAGERTELPRIVERTVALLDHRLRGRIDLLLDVPADVPAVAASSDQVEQIVINLLANAIDALTPFPTEGRAGARPLIAVRARPTAATGGPCLAIEIADNGSGIRPEAAAHLFEAFFTTKGPDAGTGLGLAVSREIARGFGGDLDLVGAPEGWPRPVSTVFRLTLPVA